MWPEVEIAKSEQRHELVLQGKTLSDRIEQNDGTVDEQIFSLGQGVKYHRLIYIVNFS